MEEVWLEEWNEEETVEEYTHDGDLYMYSFRQTSGIWYVVHTITGKMRPYCNGRVSDVWEEEAMEDEIYDLFETWICYTRRYRKKLKYMYTKNTPTFAPFPANGCVTVTCSPMTELKAAVRQSYAKTNVKKEEEMNTVDLEMKRGRYLEDRAFRINNEKEFELRKAFGLVDAPQPTTPKEFVEFIKEGKYELDEKHQDRKLWNPWAAGDYLRFRDPEVKRDEDGFNKASEILSKEYRTLMDDIAILDAKEGLEKLREFEAKTFH